MYIQFIEDGTLTPVFFSWGSKISLIIWMCVLYEEPQTFLLCLWGMVYVFDLFEDDELSQSWWFFVRILTTKLIADHCTRYQQMDCLIKLLRHIICNISINSWQISGIYINKLHQAILFCFVIEKKDILLVK